MALSGSDRSSPLTRRGSLAILFAPVVVLGCFLAVKVLRPEFYNRIVQEDAIVEDVQVVVYATAAITALGAARSARALGARGGVCAILLLWAATFSLVTFEELSWGQRLLGFRVPPWVLQHNAQDELTLHNLNIVNPHMHALQLVAALLLALGWLVGPRLRARSGSGTDRGSVFSLLFPRRNLALYFVPLALLHAYFILHPRYVGPFLIWRDQEVAELLTASGLLLHMLGIGIRMGAGTDPAGSTRPVEKKNAAALGTAASFQNDRIERSA